MVRSNRSESICSVFSFVAAGIRKGNWHDDAGVLPGSTNDAAVL